jgi:hypothetical protein
MTWSHLITPPQSVDAVFDGNPPALSELRLHETRSQPTEAGELVELLLEWPVLPEGAPPKWRAKGYKALQLLLTLHATTRVEKTGVFCGLPVSVELSPGLLTLKQSDGNASMTFALIRVSAQLRPYGGDSLHEGIHFPAFRDDA